MFIMDVHPAPVQDTPIVLTQAVIPREETLPDYVLKTCDEVLTSGAATRKTNTISPSDWLISETSRLQNKEILVDEYNALSNSISLTLIQETRHGSLFRYTSNGTIAYEYRPEPGYTGKDQAIFMAEFNAKRYRIMADIIVSRTIDEDSPQCPEPKFIKVRKLASPSFGYDSGYTLAYAHLRCAGGRNCTHEGKNAQYE